MSKEAKEIRQAVEILMRHADKQPAFDEAIKSLYKSASDIGHLDAMADKVFNVSNYIAEGYYAAIA